MTIYQQLLDGVKNGKTFSIDLEKRNLKLGKQFLVKGGKYKGEYGFLPKVAKDYVEELYEDYFNSKPSERSDSSHPIFYAKQSKKMLDEEIILGDDRYLCQAKLEGYVLGLILSNCSWENFTSMDKFFWKSDKNRHLVMFRKWFTGGNV